MKRTSKSISNLIVYYGLLACLAGISCGTADPWSSPLAAAEPSPQPSVPPSALPVPFELQPYRVKISLACAESAGLDADFCRAALEQVAETSDRLLGEMWTVTTESNQWLFPPSAERLAQLTAGRLPLTWSQDAFDKIFLITLEDAGGEYVLSGREWDSVSRIFGTPVTRIVHQRRELPAALFRLTHDLFRPRLQIERTTDGVASVTAQGGALPPGDPAFAQLRKDQYWQPFLRYRDSKGAVERLQPVPWTLLQVTDINPDSRSHGRAKIVSGLRSPLPKGRRARVDMFARALEPSTAETELRLVSRQAPQQPLVGIVVDARSKADQPATRLLTDRNGTIRIPARPEEPLLWLTVRSGEKTLAVLPIVAGLESRLTAELPDDSIRLRVEGELSILQSNLTDTVAQRAVLMARVRRLVQLGNWKSANELRKELGLLPISDSFLQELNAIRIPAVNAARAAKNKTAIAYIDRVCDDVSKLIQKYLDEEKLKAFDDELKEIERATQNAAKPAAK